MTRIALMFGTLAVATVAFAQAPAPAPADIDKALMAAPASLKDGATDIRWKADYTYETLRKGTNHLV